MWKSITGKLTWKCDIVKKRQITIACWVLLGRGWWMGEVGFGQTERKWYSIHLGTTEFLRSCGWARKGIDVGRGGGGGGGSGAWTHWHLFIKTKPLLGTMGLTLWLLRYIPIAELLMRTNITTGPFTPMISWATGRERLIRSHSSARFCFELSGNSN